MNIFYLDHDPAAAARAHCDRHVVKMILESAQLLSTAWHVASPENVAMSIGSTDPAFPTLDAQRAAGLAQGEVYYLAGNQRIYAPTHANHPSAVWVREARGNYEWLWRLATELLDEYTFRYRKSHASRHVIRTLEAPPPGVPAGAQTEPPTAMPDAAVVTDAEGYADAVASYRNYYLTEKRPLLTYTRRPPPDWARAVATIRVGKPL